MEANELMVGDWLKHANGKYYRVTRIDILGDYNSIHYACGFPHAWEYNNKFEPITLTPEILEKNGWKYEFDKADYMVKYDLGKEGKNCWMMWAIKEHNLDIQRQDEELDFYNLKVSKVVIPCDYVHQLQQAMRLCGIDKEIEL